MPTTPPLPALSVLDLAFITDETTPRVALRHTRDLARHAEELGYRRFWLAEHHNAPGVASAATAVLIGHVADGTSTIRVGAGGVMLPNHAPLIVAEQFGTLASLYPDRVDLGLGRSSGTDEPTQLALRRAGGSFPHDIEELRSYLAEPEPDAPVRAYPGAGERVPLWVLGSSPSGASVAGRLGLPFAFASHFAPDNLAPALATYRAEFRPSAQLDRPYVMVSANTVVADTDGEAWHAFTAYQQYMVNNIFRRPWRPLPAPVDDIDAYWQPHERHTVGRILRLSLVGSTATVRDRLTDLAEMSQADEIIVTPTDHTHEGRRRSLELLALARREAGLSHVTGA
ncbi:LLM class flavin-dependent oxidoreductase [Streptomyces sp. OE57]|uniref:LLM class flavin-dependent oxidoreductase n=1 Tax=Streptomyces lacaronensis TaxID=3379885 RepID=UPI0039B76B3A